MEVIFGLSLIFTFMVSLVYLWVNVELHAWKWDRSLYTEQLKELKKEFGIALTCFIVVSAIIGILILIL